MPFVPTDAGDSGDVIALDNPKAGALTLATSLADYSETSTDPVRMFARRDAFRTVAESIASGMASVPLDLYRRDAANGRTKIGEGEHAVANALVEPAPGATLYRLREACALDMELHDRWAILMLDEPDGLQLVRLPARWVSFAVDGFRRITDVVLRRPGASRKFLIPINRVIFDVGYDPAPSGDETKGYSITRTLEASATELERGAAYRAAILAGGPKVPMYVHRPADAPKWDKGGKEQFKQDFAGFSTERAGQVPLLEDGMELKAAPQLDVAGVDYRETRLAAQIEFAIAMHFPPELVGYREGNFSNIAALRELLYVDTLGSKLLSERLAWNAGLRRGGYIQRGVEYLEENVAVRLRGNPELQAGILQTQVGAPIRTVNEARRLLNLPPIDGGDELIVPLNVVKGGLASPTDTARDRKASLDAGIRRLALEAPAGLKAASHVRATATARDRLAADLASAFKQQAARVTKGLGDGSSPGSLDDAFDINLEADALQAVLLPHSATLAGIGAAAVLDKFNPDSENFDPDRMLPWLTKAAGGTAVAIVTGTFRDIAEAVVGPDWVNAVAAKFASLVDAGAELWATNVATTSTSFGSQDAARASGLGRKTWVHVGGATSRPEHEAMDGETVGLDDLFSNGLRWPGDPTGGPEDNAECRCRLEYSPGAP